MRLLFCFLCFGFGCGALAQPKPLPADVAAPRRPPEQLPELIKNLPMPPGFPKPFLERKMPERENSQKKEDLADLAKKTLQRQEAFLRTSTETARKINSVAKSQCGQSGTSDNCIGSMTAALVEIKRAESSKVAFQKTAEKYEDVLFVKGSNSFSQFANESVKESVKELGKAKAELQAIASSIDAKIHEGDWSIEFSTGQKVSLAELTDKTGLDILKLNPNQKKAMIDLLSKYKEYKLLAEKGAGRPDKPDVPSDAETKEVEVAKTELASSSSAANPEQNQLKPSEDSYKLYFGNPIGISISSIWKMINNRYAQQGISLEPQK